TSRKSKRRPPHLAPAAPPTSNGNKQALPVSPAREAPPAPAGSRERPACEGLQVRPGHEDSLVQQARQERALLAPLVLADLRAHQASQAPPGSKEPPVALARPAHKDFRARPVPQVFKDRVVIQA